MTNKELAQSILAEVGGAENVTQLTHCATRLRFQLKDSSKANDKKISSLKGVSGVVRSSGQFQVIIGTDVANVYKAFSINGTSSSSDDVKQKFSWKSFGSSIIPFIAGSISPLLPGMIGAGLIKLILTILGPTIANVLATTSDTYRILWAVSDAIFHFLPIGVAFNAAKRLNLDFSLALAVASFLLYPDLVTLLKSEDTTKLFGVIPVYHASYASSLLPALFSVLLLKGFHWTFNKYLPKSTRFILVPFFSLVLTGAITIFTLAPLGAMIGEYLAIAMQWIYDFAPWLAVGILSAAMPFIVMTGMHWALIPLHMISVPQLGYDSLIFVAMIIVNTAQGAAAMGFGLRTKDKELRSLAFSSGFLATVMGITEPAMYGINLKYKKPMYAVVGVSLILGIFAGILGIKEFLYMQGTKLIAIFGYIDPSGNHWNLIWTCVILAAAIVGTFLVSFAISGENFTLSKTEKLIKKIKEENLTVYNPIDGEVIALKDVNDATFASEVLGKGYAVQPSKNVVRAPFSGTVEVLMDSKHAISLKSNDGMQVLIHIGLDTVKLNGKHFKTHVNVGDEVKLGQKLISFNAKEIKKAGYELTTPVILTNSTEFNDIHVENSGIHKLCEKMIYINKDQESKNE